MRMLLAIGVGAGLFLTGAVAQQEEHQHPADSKMSNMECCKSMDMHQMMAGHGEAAKLVDQLVASLAAIETAKDGKARKQKLAEHGALLKELQTKLQAQDQMMQQHMGAMMRDEDHKH
jgi:hypothetical protein